MTEAALQKATGDLLAIYERQGRLVAFPVPNGSYIAGSSREERARRVGIMKRMRQLRPGVWDWVVVLPGGHVGFIELKVGKNGLNEEQDLFGGALQRLYVRHTAVCRSIDEVQGTLNAWLAA